MSKSNCLSCLKPKASLACEVCQQPVCKDCVEFLDAATFSFLKTVPPELAHTYYCGPCYTAKVAAPLETYLSTLENARSVYVFFKTQRKAVPLIRKSKEVVRVDQCDDRDELVLRLAFFAAEKGYNAIVDTDLVATKVRNHAHHTSTWRGTAVPAQVDGVKVDRMSEK
ncbi:MAG: hypothetical protein HYX41_06420 [Bdellovibrio sp.]|nr:hypothetical protein [Bdellovibrio sp.]